MNSVEPQGKITHAKKGVDWANKCVASFPREAGCYYYRAVNTGLYYEAASLNYQKGLRSMIADCHKVMQLDAAYDGGGAYQILGNIYLKVPEFSLSKKSITRDLDQAHAHAQKALEIDPQNADNQFLWAQVLYADENYGEAVPFLKQVVKNLPNKHPYTWYDRESFKAAKRLLAKAEKKLTQKHK